MTFEYNQAFMDYLERELKQPAVETVTNEYSKTRIKHFCKIAILWRWWHKTLEGTHDAFWNMGWDEMANNIETKGWRVYERQGGTYSHHNILFRQIAMGLGHEIPQLSDKTQISKDIRYNYYPIEMSHCESVHITDEPISPVVSTANVHRYTIEWRQFIAQMQSDRRYGEMDYYRFAVAYDPFNDCLYVDYRQW
jgi:hypothetical protein